MVPNKRLAITLFLVFASVGFLTTWLTILVFNALAISLPAKFGSVLPSAYLAQSIAMGTRKRRASFALLGALASLFGIMLCQVVVGV